jgi:hypothetical protein
MHLASLERQIVSEALAIPNCKIASNDLAKENAKLLAIKMILAHII